jgi:hypothetical protein
MMNIGILEPQYENYQYKYYEYIMNIIYNIGK